MNPKSATLLLILGAAVTAPCQVIPVRSSAWSAGIGVFYPGDRAQRDRTGKTNFQFALSYELPQHDPRIPRFGAFADFSTRADDKNRLGVLGLGVQVRQSLTSSASAVQPYVRAGIGTYAIAAKDNGRTRENGGRIGGLVTFGIDTKNQFFVEIGYRLVAKFHGIDASGGILTVGYRF